MTGRQLIQVALREPMRERGWASRAAGWFTKSVAPGYLGVIAVGTATEHQEAGTALATLHVHLCDEQVEDACADLCAVAHRSYKSGTATTSIGYLMPEATWREWLIHPKTADPVAAEMAAAVEQFATPYLQRLASEPGALLLAVETSASYRTSLGLRRAALVMANDGRGEEARRFVAQRLAELGDRTDAAAVDQRGAAKRLSAYLGRFE